MRSRLTVVALGFAMLALAVPAAHPAVPAAEASATATSLLVRIPGEPELAAGLVSGPPADFERLVDFALSDRPGIAAFAYGSTDVRRSPGAGEREQASAQVRGVSLLDGAIEIGSSVGEVRAAADGQTASGAIVEARAEDVKILGEAVRAEPNLQVALGDWGYVVLLEQAVVRGRGEHPGFRGFTVAAHVVLTATHLGLPVGTEILVGYAEAAAQAPPPPPPASSPPPPRGGSPSNEPAPLSPGARPEPPPLVVDPPASIRPDITRGGHVFPVYGPTSFSDDFAAPRAATGWHHGNDVFAPRGAPVLAVAAGTVFSVGWNPIGGWRLWLRDEAGNEFYYAHLAAYSPLAVDGGRVRAGDVLGFVGDSGDALGTPPHLHFEVHPSALLGLGYDGAINPYPYLLAWEASREASFDTGAFASGPAPAPGAVLLEVHDISTVSGLERGGLERMLGLIEQGGFFGSSSVQPSLVGAPAGFL
jgi:murein DD-endopeptidase MepM/ murein hydrolase activator NlpD